MRLGPPERFLRHWEPPSFLSGPGCRKRPRARRRHPGGAAAGGLCACPTGGALCLLGPCCRQAGCRRHGDVFPVLAGRAGPWLELLPGIPLVLSGALCRPGEPFGDAAGGVPGPRTRLPAVGSTRALCSELPAWPHCADACGCCLLSSCGPGAVRQPLQVLACPVLRGSAPASAQPGS